MRNTKQRELVFNIVNNSSCHFTANEIYLEAKKVNSNISLGTVYRNLNNLVESKFIRRLKMIDNIDRFDKNINHCHVICEKCGKVDDIFVDYIKELPNIKDYYVMDYDLRFTGICKKCLEEENKWN